jgi:hypothetical protein
VVALPVAQAPTAQADRACCCPRDAECHCPDHDDAGGRTAVRACGGWTIRIVAPSLIAIAPPPPAVIPATPVERPRVLVPLPGPRPAPWPTRPDAPS